MMTPTSFSWSHRAAIALISLILCSAVVAPAFAATKYTEGSPVFSASIDGVNEYAPGQNTTIRVLVKNTGLNGLKQLNWGTIEPEDLPTTAKLVNVGLASSNNDIVIKTDPQMVGDIKGDGKPVTVSFVAKITEDAATGEYQLPLTIKYRYLRPIVQETGDTFQFTYNTEEKTIPLAIRIKPQMKIEVVELTPEPIAAGSEGYVSMKIQNTGPETGRMASAKIIRNGNSPLIPTDGTVFVGEFPSGGVVDCRYKVSVAKDALNKTYPLDIAVTYTNKEGTVVTTQSTTVGIPVYGKPAFTITSTIPAIAQGSESTILVSYRNDGIATIYNAQARLSVYEPVTSSGNTAFLGDIRPGESATARYDIRAGDSAQVKNYTFDSKIRYRDALDTSQESDTIPVTVEIVPAKAGITGNLLFFIGIIAIVGAGVVLWHYHRARKMR
jgi:hypothetical protein